MGERWRTVKCALDDWGKTLRLCVILLTAAVPPAVIALLIRR